MEGECLRSGKRYLENGEMKSKHKPKKRDKKDTLQVVPIHEDSEIGLHKILRRAGKKMSNTFTTFRVLLTFFHRFFFSIFLVLVNRVKYFLGNSYGGG